MPSLAELTSPFDRFAWPTPALVGDGADLKGADAALPKRDRTPRSYAAGRPVRGTATAARGMARDLAHPPLRAGATKARRRAGSTAARVEWTALIRGGR